MDGGKGDGSSGSRSEKELRRSPGHQPWTSTPGPVRPIPKGRFIDKRPRHRSGRKAGRSCHRALSLTANAPAPERGVVREGPGGILRSDGDAETCQNAAPSPWIQKTPQRLMPLGP